MCSSWYSNGAPLFYTYCKGASYPSACGVSSNEIQADGSVQTVTATLPYDVVDSNSLTYLACYYHIYAKPYSWKSGAQIAINVKNSTDVNVYLYGGNSRKNASIALVANNATPSIGLDYVTDISTEMIVVVVPVSNKFDGNFTFTY